MLTPAQKPRGFARQDFHEVCSVVESFCSGRLAAGSSSSSCANRAMIISFNSRSPCPVTAEIKYTSFPDVSRSNSAQVSASGSSDLVDADDFRPSGQHWIVFFQFAANLVVVAERIRMIHRRRFDHVDNEPRAFDVFQKFVTKACACMSSFNQPRQYRPARNHGRDPPARHPGWGTLS